MRRCYRFVVRAARFACSFFLTEYRATRWARLEMHRVIRFSPVVSTPPALDMGETVEYWARGDGI